MFKERNFKIFMLITALIIAINLAVHLLLIEEKRLDLKQQDVETCPCLDNIISDNDSKLLAGASSLGNTINDDIAMASLYNGYNSEIKAAYWYPSKSSELMGYFRDMEFGPKLMTEVIFSSLFIQEGQPHYIVLTQTNPEPPQHSCHACSPVIGGALFKKIHGEWHLVALNREIIKGGSWGMAPRDKKFIKIGPDRYAVAFFDYYSGQGHSTEGYFIIGNIGTSIECLISVPVIAENYSECCISDKGENCDRPPCWSFNSEIEFIPGSFDDYFDIKITTSGTRTENYSDLILFKEIRTYKYAGCYFKDNGININLGLSCAVQLGAFKSYPLACQLAVKLRREKYPAYIEVSNKIGGKMYYRVRVGTFNNQEGAETVLAEIKHKGYEGFVTCNIQ